MMRITKGTGRTSLTAMLLLASSLSFAHDDLLGTRYVALEGVDEGDCDHAHEPCRSIVYALERAPNGATVKVAEGLYSVVGLSASEFFHGKAGVMGGYSVTDDFAVQDAERYITQVHGLRPAERERLLARGIHLVVDEVARRVGRSGDPHAAEPSGRQGAQQAVQVAANCVQGFAGLFPCQNVDLLSQLRLVDLSLRPGSMSNLWGLVDLDDNREYAVIGTSNATVIVEVTDPLNPREVGSVPGNNSLWREVKIYQVFDSALNRHRAYAYISTEAANGGLQIIDLSDLPASVALVNTLRDFQTSHTLHISNVDYATNAAIPGRQAFLYIAGSNLNGGAYRIYSLADPVAPQLVTAAPGGTGYMHDSTSLYLTDSRTAQCDQGHSPCEVLVDFNESSVDLWDVTDKSAPLLLSATGYPEARYTHSGWPTEDQRFVVVHDELDELRIGFNTRIYTLDIGNLLAPRIRASYSGPDTTTDHNGYTLGNRYYVAHYRRGLVVFDVTDPNLLRSVGHLDTFLSPQQDVAGTDGAWGVYPFLPSGNILISDIDFGLFVMRDNTRNLDASPGRLGLVGTAAAGAENSVINVILRRSGGSQGAVTVDFATRDGSAVAGSDYDAVSGTRTWLPGETSDQIVGISITNDAAQEGDEQFTLVLSNPTGAATIEGNPEFSVTIRSGGSQGQASGGGGGGRMDLLSLVLAAGILCWFARRRGNSRARLAALSRDRSPRNVA
jgi:choice-of-anchor B domain-containing protein